MKKNYVYLFLSLFILGTINVIDIASKSKEALINNDRIIIRLKRKYSNSDSKKIERILKVKIKSYRKMMGTKNAYVIYTKSNINSLHSKLNRLNREKSIEKSQPSFLYSVGPKQKTKSTRATADDWHVTQTQADELKNNIGTSANKVRVGVIDTGIDYKHPAFANTLNKKLSYNFMEEKKMLVMIQGMVLMLQV